MRKSFNELCIEVTKNREELKDQRELIDFLLEHDRNDVALDKSYDMWSVHLIVRYIYKKELKTTSVNVGYNLFDSDIIENDKEKIIIKCSYNSVVKYSKYYKITKSNGVSMDITDIYKEKTPTVANPDTPTETDFKYFTAEQVRNMSQKEVRENYQDIMKSMKLWN